MSFVVSLVLGLLGTAHAAPSAKPWFVVSDIDDTIKVTSVAYPVDALLNALLSRRAFAGMSTLYRELVTTSIDRSGSAQSTYYVSGGPRFLQDFAENFLLQNQFPKGPLLMRTDILGSVLDFKVGQIREILARVPNRAALLIGDDGEKDPESYQQITLDSPDQVAAVYIHRTNNRPLHEGQVQYDTAMDIALYETQAGRMTENQALKVSDSIEASEDPLELVLPWGYCPGENDPGASDRFQGRLSERLIEAARKIERKVRQICSDRQLDRQKESSQSG